MTTAQQFSRLLELVLRQPPPLRVKAWDGSEEGPQDAPLLLLNSPDAVRRLVRAPGELGLARAYVSGETGVMRRLTGCRISAHRRNGARCRRASGPSC
jgi:cyclopropane-fatty-acyl-phospholipid synthase